MSNLVVSRRILITGMGMSIIAAPALAKASWLDKILRGTNLDPKVLAYFDTFDGQVVSMESQYSNSYHRLTTLNLPTHEYDSVGRAFLPLTPEWRKLTPEQQAEALGNGWGVLRKSELTADNHRPPKIPHWVRPEQPHDVYILNGLIREAKHMIKKEGEPETTL